jgi:protein required for attachment to host cells
MMETTYVLIADAHRARCFARDAANHPLVEQADFIFPHSHLTNWDHGADLTGAAGKGHGRTGHAGTQFEPHTEAPDKQRHLFALQLAEYLNAAVAERRCKHLALITTSPMLGDIKPLLNVAAANALRQTVVKDLTHFTGPELAERVAQALAELD